MPKNKPLNLQLSLDKPYLSRSMSLILVDIYSTVYQ